MIGLHKKSDFINLSGFKSDELQVYTALSEKEKSRLTSDLLSFNEDIDLTMILEHKKYKNDKIKKGFK